MSFAFYRFACKSGQDTDNCVSAFGETTRRKVEGNRKNLTPYIAYGNKRMGKMQTLQSPPRTADLYAHVAITGKTPTPKGMTIPMPPSQSGLYDTLDLSFGSVVPLIFFCRTLHHGKPRGAGPDQ